MINVNLAWLQQTLALSEADVVNLSRSQLNQQIEYVITDSRVIEPGQVFVALKGENFDGTKFVQQVADKGAIAVVVESKQDIDIPQFIVADTLKAYGKIAAQIALESNVKTIAVTGSVGKTTVKEMCAAILAQAGKVLATAGNFNNEIGVPHTLMRFNPQFDFAVVELGANHVGEIAYTTSLTQPDVAILNNVAEAHLEGFGGISGVVKAKGEIFEGLTSNGTAIVNGDCEYKDAWLSSLTEKSVIEFTLDDTLAGSPKVITAKSIRLDLQAKAEFIAVFGNKEFPVTLSIPGRHNVANALAAASACLALGVSVEQVQAGLMQMSAVKGRMNVHKVSSSLELIDDTYNANVGSIKAAIDLLAEKQGPTALVLGDMAELGDESEFYHRQIGQYATQQKIDFLYTCGNDSEFAATEFPTPNHFFEHSSLVAALEQLVLSTKQPLTMLFKGSRSAKMELALQALINKLNKN